MLTKETFNTRKKEYAEGKIAFESFYLWLAEELRVGVSLLPLKIRRSYENKELRAIYLSKIATSALSDWETNHSILIQRIQSFGITNWSLSQTVCLLKVYATHLYVSEDFEDEKI